MIKMPKNQTTLNKINKGIEKIEKKFQPTRNLGLLAFIFFIGMLLLAYLQYRYPFSIHANPVSDLGNGFLNPDGSLFFNIGVIVTGIIYMLIFIRSKNVFVEIAGILMSFSLAMVGLYPVFPSYILYILGYNILDPFFQHSFFLDLFYKLSIFCVSIITISVGRRNRLFAYFGTLTILINSYYVLFAYQFVILEWTTFILVITFIFISSYYHIGLEVSGQLVTIPDILGKV
jgi:hypothetical protein